jgi:lysophospholipase L1-like esterase
VLTVGNNEKNIRLIGAYPIKGSSGVVLHNLGKYGSNAEAFTSEYCLDSEIKAWTPSLTIIDIMGNDWTEQTPLDEYRQHIQTLITTAKRYGDVLLISAGFNLDSHPIPQTSYISVLKNLALSNNVALLDIIGRYGEDTSYVKNTLGLLYEDNTHPNDAGHQDKATSIINILLSH